MKDNTESDPKKEKDYISFSELLVFEMCPFKWYLEYIDGHRQVDSIHNIFGTALHTAIDRRLQTGNKSTWITMCKEIILWVLDNPTPDKWTARSKGKWVTDKGYIHARNWARAAIVIYSQVFDWLATTFGKFELIGSEIRLFEPIEGIDYFFKGFVDLLIKDEEGVYHIIDFKSCDWGWSLEKRTDTKKQYQITLYKKFVCSKYGIDPNKVQTHFVLLKRTPPKKHNQACELITITSGSKKISNATEWLNTNLKRIKARKLILKKRGKCELCQFYKTPLCP